MRSMLLFVPNVKSLTVVNRVPEATLMSAPVKWNGVTSLYVGVVMPPCFARLSPSSPKEAVTISPNADLISRVLTLHPP